MTINRMTSDVIYGRQALKQGVPWIVPESLDHLKTIVQPHFRVFEWGAGGSTIWFARHCEFVTTVEGRDRWVKWVNVRLREEGLSHKMSVLHRPLPALNAYVAAIDAIENESLDLVSVDGERQVRSQCIAAAVPKVKPGGYLLLDNSNWDFDLTLEGWTRLNFKAPPHEWMKKPNVWWTSFFMKPRKKEEICLE